MFICIHKHKENIAVYSLKYLTLSITKPLLSLCTAEYLENICDPRCHPLLHSAGAAPGLPGLAAELHRNKSQAVAHPEPSNSLL